ncbi:DUF86 domain-containing protein [Roseiflexus sp.]|uniref:HepT-like ribonuclease domain-containing protein n=1 Tax=Roseiflexus sp. TaxID=2562120 RepID=UPI00398A9623
MSKRNWQDFVQDMLESIQKVEDYSGHLTSEEFFVDGKTQDAVIRNLEIIGEAARRIPDEIQQRHADIPWTQVVGLRNRLVHGYFVVDLTIVWEICKHDLPRLRVRLEQLLQEEAPRESSNPSE